MDNPPMIPIAFLWVSKTEESGRFEAASKGEFSIELARFLLSSVCEMMDEGGVAKAELFLVLLWLWWLFIRANVHVEQFNELKDIIILLYKVQANFSKPERKNLLLGKKDVKITKVQQG